MRHGPALMLTLLTACGGGHRPAQPLPPVPVDGSAHDLRVLVGNWEGEFVREGESRRGVIAFALQAGRDTAYGHVVLTGPAAPPGCTDAVTRATTRPSVGEIVLNLGRVNVDHASVGGWLRSYRDPELGCPVDTWFEGTIRGDRLEGMYFSHPADTAAAVRLGTWWAARRR